MSDPRTILEYDPGFYSSSLMSESISISPLSNSHSGPITGSGRGAEFGGIKSSGILISVIFGYPRSLMLYLRKRFISTFSGIKLKRL